MKLWLSKNSEVPLRDQIIEQISLGVASRDLDPGERLPSTNEMARRFLIHQNTVSAAYRELDRRGIVEFRRGSGFYVRANDGSGVAKGDLDSIIARFLAETAFHGHSIEEVKVRLDKYLHNIAARILLVESDSELAKILSTEIGTATGYKVEIVSSEELSQISDSDEGLMTALFDEKERITSRPAGKQCIFLQANSVSASISAESRPDQTELIYVVSAWKRFSDLARLFLLAAGLEAETIVTCSPNVAGWRKRLKNASLLICDSHTARLISPNDPRLRIFPLIAESSLDELRTSLMNRS